MVLAKSYSDQATGTRARPVGVRAPTAAARRATGLAGRRAAAPAMARMIWRPVVAWRAAVVAGRQRYAGRSNGRPIHPSRPHPVAAPGRPPVAAGEDDRRPHPPA